MRMANAPALEYTKKLYWDIKGKGFNIFLISTRREAVRDSTVDNLIDVGYHGWSRLVLRYYWFFFFFVLTMVKNNSKP